MSEYLFGDNPITIKQYATFRERITILQSAGVPQDVTSFTWKCQLRINKADGTAIATFTVNTIDAPNGVVEVVLTAAQVTTMFGLALPAGANVAFWDLLGTAPAGGDSVRYAGGPAILDYGVSH